ncbi:restriction endonuclease [Microbacterium sp. NPDC055903]
MYTVDQAALTQAVKAEAHDALIDEFVAWWEGGLAAPYEARHDLSIIVSTEVDRRAIFEFQPPARPANEYGIAALVLALSASLGAIWGFSIAPMLGVLLLIPAALFAWGAKSLWITDEKYQQHIDTQRVRDYEDWEQWRARFKADLVEKLMVEVHEAMADVAGVPRRIRAKFVAESQRNEEHSRDRWRVDWWVAQPEYPAAPGRLESRLEHDAYEQYCSLWMHSLGWLDAKPTRYSRDGGIDVTTSQHVVQCKHYDRGLVSEPAVREIFGVATAEGKQAVLITSGRFTKGAMAFADRAKVALVHLDELNGAAVGLNAAGKRLMSGPEGAQGRV